MDPLGTYYEFSVMEQDDLECPDIVLPSPSRSKDYARWEPSQPASDPLRLLLEEVRDTPIGRRKSPVSVDISEPFFPFGNTSGHAGTSATQAAGSSSNSSRSLPRRSARYSEPPSGSIPEFKPELMLNFFKGVSERLDENTGVHKKSAGSNVALASGSTITNKSRRSNALGVTKTMAHIDVKMKGKSKERKIPSGRRSLPNITGHSSSTEEDSDTSMTVNTGFRHSISDMNVDNCSSGSSATSNVHLTTEMSPPPNPPSKPPSHHGNPPDSVPSISVDPSKLSPAYPVPLQRRSSFQPLPDPPLNSITLHSLPLTHHISEVIPSSSPSLPPPKPPHHQANAQHPPKTLPPKSTHPPVLGMRRTHTAPSSTPLQPIQLPTRQRGFRPPLLSQQPRTADKEAERLRLIESGLQDAKQMSQSQEAAAAIKRKPLAPGPTQQFPKQTRRALTRYSSNSQILLNNQAQAGQSSQSSLTSSTSSAPSHSYSHDTRHQDPGDNPDTAGKGSSIAQHTKHHAASPIKQTSAFGSSSQRTISRNGSFSVSHTRLVSPDAEMRDVELELLPQPSDGDPDSSFGELSFDIDELEATMQQYD